MKIKKMIKIGTLVIGITASATNVNTSVAVDSNILEAYSVLDRLDRLGNRDDLIEGIEFLKENSAYSRRFSDFYRDLENIQMSTEIENWDFSLGKQFFDTLENGDFLIFDLDEMKEDGEKKLKMTNLHEILPQEESSEIEDLKNGEEKIIYAKMEAFEEKRIKCPKGYKKCICVDYIQEIDENSVGDYDYVQIFSRNKTSTSETREFYTKGEYKNTLNIIKELTKDVNDSDNDFAKMLKIYVNVMKYMSYNLEVLDNFRGEYTDSSDGNAKALIKGGLGVCAAYADVIFNAGRYKGIEVFQETGKKKDDILGHSWCYFIYEDKYGEKHKYGIDATWGDVLESDSELTFDNRIDIQTASNFAGKDFMEKHDFVNQRLFSFEPIDGIYEGYEYDFIMRYIYLTNANINIRPEPVIELEKQNGIYFMDLMELKEENPELFKEPVELNLDLIINKYKQKEQENER